MNCLVCKDLKRALESRRSKYIEARSAAYYRVSTELAAYKNVDMERAKSDLEEHQLVCVTAAKVRQSGPRASRACLDSTLGRHTGDI
jgi:Zn-dependent peptidase ImmA (M78 family)